MEGLSNRKEKGVDVRTSLRFRWSALIALVLGAGAPAAAATLPPGFAEKVLATGLSNPTAMTLHPDGRIFVCQQSGRLRIIKNDLLLPTPFATVAVNADGERGLLGVAIDPNYAANRFVYVYRTTNTAPLHNEILRFTAMAGNEDIADPAIAPVRILRLPDLQATNHNGGAIHFGPDDKLYVAVGDNARNPSPARSLNTTLGKYLRINRDGSVPTDNPFISQTTGENQKIWARGLRNPFTFTFQRGTGRMHINDVGQNTWEEVNNGVAGRDYGWPDCEGAPGNSAGTCDNPPAGATNPLFTYRNDATTCAIVGAAFYSPVTRQFPTEWLNRYFFADFCAGTIRFLNPPGYTGPSFSTAPFATNLSSPVDLAVSDAGFLYYLERGNTGRLVRVRSTVACVPAGITTQPASQTVTQGQMASFSVLTDGTQPLSFQWQRANPGSTTFNNIGGATSSSFSLTAQLTDSGARFRVIVTNACGTVTSAAATLTVVAIGPTAQITQPADGTKYVGGQTINFAGIARDPSGNALPASTMTWTVDLQHGTDHAHPVLLPTTGITSGSFFVDDVGHTETNVFYRIHLHVSSGGQTADDETIVNPTLVILNVRTSPSGLGITIDGQPTTAPQTVPSVVGVFRSIGTRSPQMLGGSNWNFDNWSDGGLMTHQFRTPAANTTFTATFIAEGGDCVVATPGADWQNRAFAAETGTFTAEFDATPSVSPMSGHVGLSLGSQNAYTGFANIVRFNASGTIDARNAGAYAAAASISYQGGATYHFRLVVNVPAHRYSIFVTRPGETERVVGSNFAFRTEQNTVSSLDWFGAFVPSTSPGQLTVCGFQVKVPAVCTVATAGGGFVNKSMASQTGSFDFEFDATPSASLANSTIGLSNGAQSAHTGLAAIARFNSLGNIDARNGGAYAAASTITYSGGQTYHFRLAVDVATHTYSIFVTRPGEAERTVGVDFAFRTEQAAVSQLDSWNAWIGSPAGAQTSVCNVKVTPTGGGGGGGGTAPTAAELIAKLGACSVISTSSYSSDSGTAANIPVCQRNDVIWWKSDLDIDCDGVTTAQCNLGTDPAFQPDTAFHASNGAPLNAAQLPYVVIPSPSGRFDYSNHNIQGGAVVAVVFNNKVEYAVFGDTGPTNIIGEASYACANNLGIEPNPSTGGADGPVWFIVFPGSQVDALEDHAKAVTLGQQLARQFVGQ